MGLGALDTVGLADAREKAAACRREVADGIDPIEARDARRLKERAAAANVITFEKAAERYIEAHSAKWRNDKHAAQWTSTLATYAGPVIGKVPVHEIDTPMILRVLEPIWHEKTETAQRVRGRIEAVLGWATVHHYRSGDNPARWRGLLDKALPKPAEIAKTEHHAALPYQEIGAFMHRLRSEQGMAARAVEFVILTACRTSEAFNATREEFDLDAGVWIVPTERMKSKRPHRVPLSRQALKLVKSQPIVDDSPYLFPGAKEGKPLSNMAGLQLLQRMGVEVTVHGFRSTFRQWAAEMTNYPREVAEAALAHVLKDKVEAAYQRGDLLDKRAKLMQAWSDYCGRVASSGKVVEMPNRAAR